MTEKGLVIREDEILDKAVAVQIIETRFAMATRQRELLEKYIRERLKPEKHYYTVGDDPGRKPSLTKEGAELICLPHALKPRYVILSGPDHPPADNSPYQITMNCELFRGEIFEGGGVGSASSYQTTRAGEYKPRQKDPGLCHNATVKMASKSAYIAATLNATAASEFFTQDLEDDQTGSFKDKSEGKEHWCHIHQTSWFKSGKMKWYAHPVKDAKGKQIMDEKGKPVWCSEEEVKKQMAEQPQDEPESPPEASGGATRPTSEESSGKIPRDLNAITSIEKLAKALKEDFGLNYQEMWDRLGIDSWNGLTISPKEAYNKVAEGM